MKKTILFFIIIIMSLQCISFAQNKSLLVPKKKLFDNKITIKSSPVRTLGNTSFIVYEEVIKLGQNKVNASYGYYRRLVTVNNRNEINIAEYYNEYYPPMIPIQKKKAEVSLKANNEVLSKERNTLEMKIFPNPAHSILKVEYNTKFDRSLKVVIHNLLGQKVKTFDYLVGKKNTYSIKDIKEGVYMVSIEDLTKVLDVRKVVIK
ncbi:MAG: T9SS type A sorting domain-containing protein [Hyphomicrobiales bacterium]